MTQEKTQERVWQIATVCHESDSEQLQIWADHWKSRGQLVVFVTGALFYITAELPEDAVLASAYPADEPPEMRANMLSSMLDVNGYTVRTWLDETMPDSAWEQLVEHVKADPACAVWMVSRRSFIDGIDRTHAITRSDAVLDWTPLVTTGPSVDYPLAVLQHPRIMSPLPLLTYANSDEIWIERRHTLASALAANERVMSYARQSDAAGLEMVNARLKELCGGGE